MAKVKELTMAFKKGLPNYGSVNSFITVQVEEGDDLDEVWNFARKQALDNCVEKKQEPDPDWIDIVDKDEKTREQLIEEVKQMKTLVQQLKKGAK
jgi:hypothetical protein